MKNKVSLGWDEEPNGPGLSPGFLICLAVLFIFAMAVMVSER